MVREGKYPQEEGKIVLVRQYTSLVEKAMAAHSTTLAWRIPGTGEPGGLPSLGLHRVQCAMAQWK